MSYALVNGHKVPLVLTEMRKGRIFFHFQLQTKGEVVWPASKGTSIYGDDDELVFFHPVPIREYVTKNGYYLLVLPVHMEELAYRPAPWRRDDV